MTDFGRELSCTTSIRTDRYVTGARLVAEAAYRRLTTPRGTLRGGDDEADYGLDLLDLVGSVATPAEAAALPDRIKAELRKDDRIDDVKVTVSATTEGPATTWEILLEAETGAGPFSLTLGVNDVSVEILNLAAEAA